MFYNSYSRVGRCLLEESYGCFERRVSGFFAGVPIRIHIFTGQVWANLKGPKRWLLKFMDKVLVLFGNHFLVDGEGQQHHGSKVMSQRLNTVLTDIACKGV